MIFLIIQIIVIVCLLWFLDFGVLILFGRDSCDDLQPFYLFLIASFSLLFNFSMFKLVSLSSFYLDSGITSIFSSWLCTLSALHYDSLSSVLSLELLLSMSLIVAFHFSITSLRFFIASCLVCKCIWNIWGKMTLL